MTRRLRIYRVGKLEVTRSSLQDGVLIDWRLREPGRRWRIQLDIDRRWLPMYTSAPTWDGRLGRVMWAFWAIGNESPKSPQHDW